MNGAEWEGEAGATLEALLSALWRRPSLARLEVLMWSWSKDSLKSIPEGEATLLEIKIARDSS